MRTVERDIVGALIFSKDGKLLLGKSREGGVYPGCWLLPGGGIDAGETKLEAVTREVAEETGLDISDAEVTFMDFTGKGESEKTLRDTGERVLVKMNFNNFKIFLPVIAAEAKVKADDDFRDIEWFEAREWPKLALLPNTIELLKELRLI